MANLGEYIGAGSGTTKLLLHLNGNSQDHSGNNNHGTDTNITYSQANGKFGQGAGFDATSDKILIANESQFDFERTNSFTISLWTKINSTGVNRFIVAKQVPSGNFTGWALWQNTSNSINFDIVNTTTNLISVNTAAFTDTTNWNHILATYDGSSSASGAKIYINGQPQSLTVAKDNLSASILNDVQLEVGNRNGAFNYNGAIDEVIIENRAWTASEIKKYYTNAKGMFHL